MARTDAMIWRDRGAGPITSCFSIGRNEPRLTIKNTFITFKDAPKGAPR
eukprot:CAMPEP_0168470746 /NCGR_PEP_ID=MMETSP0228-20121227/58903_1 /TAXON_ID=133427 /ORGANISM="Protoceratium reticulatum, Strain CCCM 535 (=CCMP 1889)" /LENGTH=48 /DNA_ID= /DNA_START= /DNA_END= /DNA_ORIENTATION=